jgi:hypothetical protein
LVGVAELDAQAVVSRRGWIRIQLDLRDVILDVIAGVAANRAVDALEAVTLTLHGLQHPGQPFALIAGVCVQIDGAVVASAQVEVSAEIIGDGRGNHVQRPAGRARADCDGGGPFKDLETGHAPLRREIIGGRSSVGCRGDQDAILQERDSCTPVEPGAPDTNIGPQSEPFLFLQVDTRYRAQHAQDIGVIKNLEFLDINDMGRARHVGNVHLPPNNRDIVNRGKGLLCVGLRAERGRRGERNGGEQDAAAECFMIHLFVL